MMQYQIRNDYNRTALPGNLTDAAILQVTSAWDTMQVKVGICCHTFQVKVKKRAYF